MLNLLRTFAKKLPTILANIFIEKHDSIYLEKSRVALEFNKIVRQYYHLSDLALTASNIMKQSNLTQKMAEVWFVLDFDKIATKAVYFCQNAPEALRIIQMNVYQKLLLGFTVAQWAEWIYTMTEEFMPQVIINF